MKLLLDEMLSPAIAAALRERGHDVSAIKGSEHEGASDADVLDLAREQGRALVTNNLRDFRPLHAQALSPGGPGHAGMIFMPGTYRRSKRHIGALVAALEALLNDLPGDLALANAEAWLA